MDRFLSVSLMLVILGIPLYAIFLRYNKPNKIGGTSALPPGKIGLPVIGETLEFLRLALRGNPEKFITDRMNKKHSSKIFTTSLMGEKMVVFCGTSGNKCLFSSDKKYVNTWLPRSIRKILVSPDNTRVGEMYSNISKENHSVVNVFIKPEALQQKFVGVMDYVSRQEKQWAPHREVLAFELAKKYAFSLACRVFVSVEDPKEVARLEDLFKGITAGITSIPINFPSTTLNRAIRYANVFRKEILAMIKQRKIDLVDKRSDSAITSSQLDLLSYILLSTDEDGELRNDINIADMILGFFVAGHDTTSTVITYIIKYLTELPHVYAEVVKEQLEIAKNEKPGELLNWKDIQQMKYLWSVANETMRLAPPAQGTFRETIADFIYAGFIIPKECKAYWLVHSTYKNPEYFKNPEKFDPSRFLGNGPASYSFVPFGGGPHICPGREYARIEILVFIHNLVIQFEFKKLLPDEKTIYIMGAILTIGLPIHLQSRSCQTN